MEVDEGAKLAKKVDELRRLSANEEARINKYRIANSKEALDQIAQLVSEKEKLQSEITSLKEERRLLQIPLDDKWIEISEKEKKISEINDDLVQKHFALEEREREIMIREREIEEIRAKVDKTKKYNQELNKKRLTEAENAAILRQEAEDTLRVAREKSREILADLRLKEDELAVQQRDTKNQAALLEDDRTYLKNWERQLNDKYETLNRTQQRIKNV